MVRCRVLNTLFALDHPKLCSVSRMWVLEARTSRETLLKKGTSKTAIVTSPGRRVLRMCLLSL